MRIWDASERRFRSRGRGPGLGKDPGREIMAAVSRSGGQAGDKSPAKDGQEMDKGRGQSGANGMGSQDSGRGIRMKGRDLER